MGLLTEKYGIASPNKRVEQNVQSNNSMSQAPQKDQQLEYLQEHHPVLNWFAEKSAANPKVAKFIEALAQKTQPIKTAGDYIGLPSLGGGVLEELHNIPASILNAGLDPFTGKEGTIPYAHFNEMVPSEIRSDVMKNAGNVVGNLLTFGATPGLGSSRIPGYMGMVADALKGIGGGWLTSGENRGLGAALGGIFGGLSHITPSATAERLSGMKQDVKSNFNKIYNSIWKESEKEGINKVGEMHFNMKPFRHYMDPKIKTSFLDHLGEGDIKGLHFAKSEMLGFIRKLNKIEKKVGKLTPGERKALNNANKVTDSLEKEIVKSLSNPGKNGASSNLAERYLGTQEDYAKNMVPLESLGDLSKYESSIRSSKHAKELSKALSEDIDFTTGIGKPYSQEMELYNLISKHLPKLLGLGAIGAGVAGYKDIYNMMRSK